MAVRGLLGAGPSRQRLACGCAPRHDGGPLPAVHPCRGAHAPHVLAQCGQLARAPDPQDDRRRARGSRDADLLGQEPGRDERSSRDRRCRRDGLPRTEWRLALERTRRRPSGSPTPTSTCTSNSSIASSSRSLGSPLSSRRPNGRTFSRNAATRMPSPRSSTSRTRCSRIHARARHSAWPTASGTSRSSPRTRRHLDAAVLRKLSVARCARVSYLTHGGSARPRQGHRPVRAARRRRRQRSLEPLRTRRDPAGTRRRDVTETARLEAVPQVFPGRERAARCPTSVRR